jgi:hypothetical protein
MVAGELELKETELVAMQYLLEGENFGASYDEFRDKNLNDAQFRADQQANMYIHDAVQRATEGGRLAEINFSVGVPSQSDDGREVDVIAYRDGHFRSSNNTPNEVVDEFFGNLAIVLQYRDKLIPLGERLEDYIEEVSAGMSQTRKREVMMIDRAFTQLIDNHFTAIDYDEEERDLYKSIIANVGIELSKIDLSDDDLPDMSDFDGDNLNYQSKIKDFFENYAAYVEGGYRPNFDLLAGHLNHIMTNSDECDSLTGLLSYVEDRYDI